jgi:hypothetical protein
VGDSLDSVGIDLDFALGFEAIFESGAESVERS